MYGDDFGLEFLYCIGVMSSSNVKLKNAKSTAPMPTDSGFNKNNKNAEDTLQLRGVFVAFEKLRSTETIDREQCRNLSHRLLALSSNDDLFKRDIAGKANLELIFYVLENATDQSTTLALISTLIEINKETTGSAANRLVAHEAHRCLLSVLSSRGHDLSYRTLLALITMISKLSNKDKKFGLKARLTGALPPLLSIVRSSFSQSGHARLLCLTLNVLRNCLQTSPTNAGVLGRHGGIHIFYKLISKLTRKQLTSLKNALQIYNMMLKYSKMNASRAVGIGSVQMMLEMHREFHKVDHKHDRNLTVRKTILNILKNLSALKSGRVALSQANGLNILYKTCREYLKPAVTSKNTIALLTVATLVISRCQPKQKLPVPAHVCTFSYNLVGKQKSDEDLMSVMSGGNDEDEDEDVIDDEDEGDGNDDDDDSDGGGIKKGFDNLDDVPFVTRLFEDLKMYEKFFLELTEFKYPTSVSNGSVRGSVSERMVFSTRQEQPDHKLVYQHSGGKNNESGIKQAHVNRSVPDNLNLSGVDAVEAASRSASDESGSSSVSGGSDEFPLAAAGPTSQHSGSAATVKSSGYGRPRSQTSSKNLTSKKDNGARESSEVFNVDAALARATLKSIQIADKSWSSDLRSTASRRSVAAKPSQSKVSQRSTTSKKGGNKKSGKVSRNSSQSRLFPSLSKTDQASGSLYERLKVTEMQFKEMENRYRLKINEWAEKTISVRPTGHKKLSIADQQFLQPIYPNNQPMLSTKPIQKMIRTRMVSDLTRVLKSSKILRTIVFDSDPANIGRKISMTGIILASKDSSSSMVSIPTGQNSDSSLPLVSRSKPRRNSSVDSTAGGVKLAQLYELDKSYHPAGEEHLHLYSDRRTTSTDSNNMSFESQASLARSVGSSSNSLRSDESDGVKAPPLKFASDFESGNLRTAIRIRECEYDLILNCDCNNHHHFQWFYFEVSNMIPDVDYVFNVVNCEKPASNFNEGMQPVMFSGVEARLGRPYWTRVGYNVCYYRNHYLRYGHRSESKSETCFFSASFTINFPHKDDICYIAYHYPYPYSRLQMDLEYLVEQADKDRIFIQHQVLCQTMSGNPCPVLTITAPPTNQPNRKKAIDELKSRPYIFLTARVHPGETNASWTMRGTLQLLLTNPPKSNEKSPSKYAQLAEELRKSFIFKIVPMLNPDGVINGHHRCSLSGNDLNRVWKDPNPLLHPTIYHTKGLLQYLQAINKAPFVFCDYHGHSRRMNVFMYGCCIQDSVDQGESASITNPTDDFGVKSLARILHHLAPTFSVKNCNFVVEKSKLATARVVVWKEIGVTRSYTMESTYCGLDQGDYRGKQINISMMETMGFNFLDAINQLKGKYAVYNLPKFARPEQAPKEMEEEEEDLFTINEQLDGRSDRDEDEASYTSPPPNLSESDPEFSSDEAVAGEHNSSTIVADKESNSMRLYDEYEDEKPFLYDRADIEPVSDSSAVSLYNNKGELVLPKFITRHMTDVHEEQEEESAEDEIEPPTTSRPYQPIHVTTLNAPEVTQARQRKGSYPTNQLKQRPYNATSPNNSPTTPRRDSLKKQNSAKKKPKKVNENLLSTKSAKKK